VLAWLAIVSQRAAGFDRGERSGQASRIVLGWLTRRASTCSPRTHHTVHGGRRRQTGRPRGDPQDVDERAGTWAFSRRARKACSWPAIPRGLHFFWPETTGVSAVPRRATPTAPEVSAAISARARWLPDRGIRRASVPRSSTTRPPCRPRGADRKPHRRIRSAPRSWTRSCAPDPWSSGMAGTTEGCATALWLAMGAGCASRLGPKGRSYAVQYSLCVQRGKRPIRGQAIGWRAPLKACIVLLAGRDRPAEGTPWP